MEVSVTINRAERSADLEPRTLLVHFLRDQGLPDVSATSLVKVPWLAGTEGVTSRETRLLKNLGLIPEADITS